MTVSVSLINSLVEGVRRAGVDVDNFLKSVAFDQEFLAQAHNRVALADYDLLIERSLIDTGDAALGLHLGELESVTAFNVVEYMAANAENIRHGLDIFERYFHLLYEGEPPQLLEDGDRATILLTMPQTSALCNRLRAEYSMIRMLKFGELLLGTGESATLEICFTHSQPDYIEEYDRLFHCPVKFDQPQTTLVFRRELLDASKRIVNQSLIAFLQEQAEGYAKYQSVQDSWCDKVSVYIKQNYQVEKPEVGVVAKAFNVSSRTLQRRLQQEGKTYAELVSETLADIARELLAKPDNTIKEVSYLMGFSSTTAFHRAFKRWTGDTPQVYKVNQQAQ